MRRLGRVVLGLLAAWGLLLSAAWGLGWLSPVAREVPAGASAWLAHADPPAPSQVSDRTPAPGSGEPSAAATAALERYERESDDRLPAASSPGAEAPPAAATETSVPSPSRFAVCERARTLPRLTVFAPGQLAPVQGARPWIGLHCGGSVHLLEARAGDGGLLLERLMTLRSKSGNEGALASRLYAEDVDLDGRPELIVPLPKNRPGQSLQDGRSYVLSQRQAGGFEPPRQLLAAAPSAVQKVPRQAGQPAYLALLVPRPQLVPTAAEVWALSLGPAPSRSARWKVAPGAERAALADFDGDGQMDLLTAGARAPLELRRPAAAGEWQAPLSFPEAQGVHDLIVGDFDQDGRSDAIAVGQALWLLRGGVESTLETVWNEALRDIQVVTASPPGKTSPGAAPQPVAPDGDGARMEIVGYAHPAVVRLQRASDGQWSRETLFQLAGELAVVETHVADLDGDGAPELVVVTQDREGGRVGVSLVSAESDAGTAPSLHLPQGMVPVADAPFALDFELP